MKQQLMTLLMGQIPAIDRGDFLDVPAVKSSPRYSLASLPRPITLGEETVGLDGSSLVFTLRGYAPDILLIKTTVAVENIFDHATFELEKNLYQKAYEIFQGRGGNLSFCEEYSIFAVTDYPGAPEQFLTNAPMIASLLKSEDRLLDDKEIAYTLQSQIKYEKNDLSIIDWDGAFLFDPSSDILEDIELLTLANLQLLRHRILDQQLDDRRTHLAQILQRPARKFVFRNADLQDDIRKTIQTQLESITDLQRIERDIRLIGDWYSARFYDLAAAKFKIEDWRKSIRAKVQSLQDIYSLIIQNFTVSAKHHAEWLQIIFFFILQLGWFILIWLELHQLLEKP